MLELAVEYGFTVSEIAGGVHGDNSRHYAGVAFDVTRINGRAVNASHPEVPGFRERGAHFGATEIRGPGDGGHATHVHLAWPRNLASPSGKDDLYPTYEGATGAKPDGLVQREGVQADPLPRRAERRARHGAASPVAYRAPDTRMR
jgi:hypothetical protein